MTTRREMARRLEAAGWKPVRRSHEPVYWRDPLECETMGWRTEIAFAMLEKREKAGIRTSKGGRR